MRDFLDEVIEKRGPLFKARLIALAKHRFRHRPRLDVWLADDADVAHVRCLVCGWTYDVTGREMAAYL